MSIGDLYANDHREYTVEVSIPEGAGTLRAAQGLLRCDCGREILRGERGFSPGFTVDVHYTDDAAELIKGKDWDVQGKADLSISTRKVEHAMKALDEGRRDDARQELIDAKAELMNSPALLQSAASAPVMKEQIRQLGVYSDSVGSTSSDLRRVKKSMQFENYKTQRQKK